MFHQREYRVYFLQAFTILVGIRGLTHPSLMANRCDDNDHHNNNNNEVEDVVLTEAEFHQFCEERQQTIYA